MKKHKTQYTNEPIGKIKIISDFLPDPKDLIFKEDTVKVTLTLTRSSIDFFKAIAKTNHTQYQKMIRELLAQYATRFKQKNKNTES